MTIDKKSLVLKIVSILMTIISVGGGIFVFNNTEFDYAGLPIYLVYVMLCVATLITLYIFWLTLKKGKVK